MSASGITITIEGQPADLDDVSWASVAPCGCLAGLTVAFSDFGPGDPHVVATASQAASEFWSSKAERAKYERLGFVVQPYLRGAAVDNYKMACEHTPKYGYSIPKPDGHVWAVGGYHDSLTSVLHLVPVEAAPTDEDRHYGGASSLCGVLKPAWSREWSDTDGRVECSRCTKAAS